MNSRASDSNKAVRKSGEFTAIRCLAPTVLGGIALVAVFVTTAALAQPQHYSRALIGAVVIMQVARRFIGARYTGRILEVSLLTYVALVISAFARHQSVDLVSEAWTLALFAAGASLMLVREVDVRAQLSNMVMTDALTGCLNRRGFDQALQREAARAARAENEFALLAIDLDHFKLLNDSHGHVAGDTILRDIGTMLTGAGRAGDVVARMGGEEFAILLPETGAEGATLFATRLCERIRSHRFMLPNGSGFISVTTSIGVAVGHPRGEAGFAPALWARADAALYSAKRACRDCVREWSEDMSTSSNASSHTARQRSRPSSV